MVFLNQHSAAQIFILLVVSVIFQIIIVISNPKTDSWDQRITWMIEVSVSIYLYALLSLKCFMRETTQARDSEVKVKVKMKEKVKEKIT
jgi:hypothetical protein